MKISKKKMSVLLMVTILASISLFVLKPSNASAIFGACSYNNGVNCSAGASSAGNVQCNDGWINSLISFYDAEECKISYVFPCQDWFTLRGLFCENESDYIRIKQEVARGEQKTIYTRSGLFSSAMGQDEIDLCRGSIDIYDRAVASCNNINKKEKEKEETERLIALYIKQQKTEREAKIDKVFSEHFYKTLEAIPEYKGIADYNVIKTLSLDPVNAKKTFTQIIKERYPNVVKPTPVSDASIIKEQKPIVNIKSVSQQEKKIIDIPYSDGSLIKAKDGKQVYFVEEEKLRPINSSQTFKNYGFKEKNVKNIASDEIKKYEIDDEALLPYPNGALLKSANKVYFVEEEKLRPINSSQTFKNYGFKVKDIKNIASDEIKKYKISDEELLPYPDGTLLKSNGKIYFVQDEKIRYISSFKIFRAHNFKLKNAINVDSKIIDEYEIGEDLLPYPNGALLKSANRLYLIQGDECRYVSSLKALKNLKRKNIIIVAPEVIEEYEEGEALN